MPRGIPNKPKTTKAKMNSAGTGIKNPRKRSPTSFDQDPELRKKATALSHKGEAQAKQITQQKQSSFIKRVRPETDTYFRDIWFGINENGISNAHQFIQNEVKEALNDPNSFAARYFLDKFAGDNILDRLDKTLEEEQNKNLDFQIYRIRQTLFDQQQEVFDNTLDKLIMNISGRRWGKSELNQRKLIAGALKHKESIGIYINRNFDNAISQGYDTAVKILDELKLPYNGSRGNGTIEFNNGTIIYYRGASNTVDVDKFRGVAKMYMAVIDEGCHLKGLRYLLTEVLQPATIDIADSQIVITGTPPRSKNYAYNLWFNNNAKVKRYNFNFMGNPFIPNRDTVLEDAAKLNGVDIDSAFIRREYLGDMNALDDDSRIFTDYATIDRNSINVNITYDRAYIGVDWGHEDSAAVVGFVADKNNKQLIEVWEWHEPKKSSIEVCEKVVECVNYINEKFHCAKSPYIITDTNEKDNTLTLAQVYHLKNVMCAYKFNKNGGLKQLARMMTLNNIQIWNNSYLSEEAENMLWKRDEETDKILEEVDDDAYHANGMFALLYISRQFALDIMGWVDINKPAKDVVEGVK